MKVQMRFQKILSTVTLVIAALTIVYALIFMTGSITAMYRSGLEPVYIDGVENDINATHLYETAQSFNDLLFVLGIVFVVVAVTLFITSSNKRRNYYITNYISVIAVAAFAIIFAVISIIFLSVCLNMFINEVNWEAFRARYAVELGGVKRWPYYSDSPAMFVIGYILFAVVLVDAAALILNLIWKIKLMKGEKALLQGGLVKEVA